MNYRRTTIAFMLLQFVITFGNTALCQNAFTFSYSTLADEIAYDGIETEDGGFIVTVTTGAYSPPNLYSTLLIKMNSQGDTIKTKSIVKNAGTCSIADLVKDIDGNFFGIGVQESAQETKLWLLKINSDLELLIDTTYSINLLYVSTFYGFLDHNNHLIFYGGAGNDYGQIHPFVYKLTQKGDSVSYMYYPDNGSETVYSMIEKPDFSGYYMMIWGQYQVVKPSPGQILTFNESLEITSIDSLPKELNMYYNAKIFNNHEFILTGKVNESNDSRRTDLLGIKKLDTSFSWQQSNSLGPPDTINYPGYCHNLDFIDTSNIFYGGTSNQALAVFSSNQSYFLFGKFDSDLNLKWQKYFGGDMYYSLWGLTATSDGGCLLYGSSFNYLTQNMERDVFIVKTDSEGVITGSDEKSDRWFHDLIIYPNPGKDYFIIEPGPQVKGDRFILRDLSGSQLIDLQINAPKVSVDTKSLSDGTYIWQLIRQNRVIDSGKWIKRTMN